MIYICDRKNMYTDFTEYIKLIQGYFGVNIFAGISYLYFLFFLLSDLGICCIVSYCGYINLYVFACDDNFPCHNSIHTKFMAIILSVCYKIYELLIIIHSILTRLSVVGYCLFA